MSWRPLVLLVVGVIGCATGPRRSGDAHRSLASVTPDELTRYAPSETLLEALRRIRPTFFSGRSTPWVVIDGAPPAELGILGTIHVSAVVEVRLHRASSSVGQAGVTPDGRVVVRDVLVVRTRPGH